MRRSSRLSVVLSALHSSTSSAEIGEMSDREAERATLSRAAERRLLQQSGGCCSRRRGLESRGTATRHGHATLTDLEDGLRRDALEEGGVERVDALPRGTGGGG